METTFLRSFGILLVLIGAAFAPRAGARASRAAAALDPRCPTGFVNMGDSLTDTGNAVNAFPYSSDPENPPYGQTFFGKQAKRFCNGRVVPDFFSLAFDTPLLDGYFAPAGFDYSHGINFAVGGATASNIATALTPFSLTFQINQFLRFVNSSRFTQTQLSCQNFYPDLPADSAYSKWLYTMTIGGLDILDSLQNGTPTNDIITKVIPAAVQNISSAIQTLYSKSARKFLIFNVPAQGCSTIVITLFGGLGLPTDSFGCIIPLNQLIQALNGGILTAVTQLRQALPDASIALFDYYTANYEILQNPLTYGFNPNLTTTACCGAPGVGTLNYNPNVTCGHPDLGSNLCANPEEYVNWDGVHFTDHFYREISKFALSGRFTDKGTNYTAICDLDFSNFGSQATFTQACRRQCGNVFA